MGTIIDKRNKSIRLGDLKPGVEFAFGNDNKEFGIVLSKDGLIYPSNDQLSSMGIPTSIPMIPIFSINDSRITWKAERSLVTSVCITHEIHNL